MFQSDFLPPPTPERPTHRSQTLLASFVCAVVASAGCAGRPAPSATEGVVPTTATNDCSQLEIHSPERTTMDNGKLVLQFTASQACESQGIPGRSTDGAIRRYNIPSGSITVDCKITGNDQGRPYAFRIPTDDGPADINVHMDDTTLSEWLDFDLTDCLP